MFGRSRISFLLSLVAVAAIGTSTLDDTHAQSAGASPAAIRVAATWAAPLASQSLFDPSFLEKLNLLASREIWAMPAETGSWPLMDGEPLVETRQLDEMWHTVRPYQTRQKIQAMYKMGLKKLQHLNPDADLNELETGQQLLVWRRDARHISESRGHADRGRLRHGEPMPDGEGYIRIFPHRTFGTYYTISEISRVLANYNQLYPDADPLMIGDISLRGGGRIRPHRSHRTGRDVDITYPRLDSAPNYNRFHYIRRKNLDVARSFWLLKDFIDGGQVEYIFVNRRWQRLLRKYAAEQGAPEAWLSAVFQNGSMRPGRSIIRHASGHDKHFHVRFKCQETDRRCY